MRDALDRYYTPDEVALAIVRWLAIPPSMTVVEPSVGDGAWVRALRATGHQGRIVGVDLDPDAAGLHLVDEAHVGDWCEVAARAPAGLHLGNPPFKVARQHIEASLAVGARAITFLRSTFVELTDDRAELWATRSPAWEWTLGDRISMRGPAERPGKTDSVCYTVFGWSPGRERRPWPREAVSIKRGLAPVGRIAWVG